MSEPKVVDLSISTLFCDEVRQEPSGKSSIVGVYHREFVVQEFPATIRQLVVRTVIVRPAKLGPTGSFKFKYELPNGETEQVEVSDEVPSYSRNVDDFETRVRRTINTHRFTDMQVSSPGALRVRVKIGDTLYAAGALRIVSALQLFDEAIDFAIDSDSLETALFYSTKFLPKIGSDDKPSAFAAFIDILNSTFGRKVDIDESDSDLPIWIVADRMSLWILKTQPWQSSSSISIRSGDVQLPFKASRESAIAFRAEFEEPITPFLRRIVLFRTD